MKKYSFNLERVLEYRQDIERLRQKEMTDLQMKLEEERVLLGRWNDHRRECQSDLADHVKGGLTVEELRLFEAYLEMIANAVIVQKERVRQGIMRLEEKRKELIEASQKKRILERLKENEIRTYLKSVDKWEQNYLDEVSIQQYISQQSQDVR